MLCTFVNSIKLDLKLTSSLFVHWLITEHLPEKLYKIVFILKQVTLINSSLLLNIDLQNTQTLPLNKNGNYLQK